jgi:hypothetical protein
MISSSLRSIRELISVNNSVDFFVNIDFFKDDFFKGYIISSIRRDTIQEPRSVVYNYFNSETG